MQKILKDKAAEDKLSIVVLRDGKEIELKVVLTER
jgi:S1-C subfamily serine protease